MHSFRSIYTALIKTFSVSRIVYSKPEEKIQLAVEFFAISLSLFTFCIQFILFVGKEVLEIKRTFDQFTLAHSSLI